MVYQTHHLGVPYLSVLLSEVDTLHIFSITSFNSSLLNQSEFASMDSKAQWSYLGLFMDRLNLQIEAQAFSMTKSSAKKADPFPTKEVVGYYRALGQKLSILNLEKLINEQLDYLRNELQLGVDPELLQNLNVSYDIEDNLPIMTYPRFQIKKLSALEQKDPNLIQAGTRKIYFQFANVDGKISAPIIPIWSPISIPDNVGSVRFAW